jgi:hypothetical protein
MVRTGTRRPASGGTLRIRDRAVLMADWVPMRGGEFPLTGSTFPGALSLMIHSQIGETRRAAGVTLSRPVQLSRPGLLVVQCGLFNKETLFLDC